VQQNSGSGSDDRCSLNTAAALAAIQRPHGNRITASATNIRLAHYRGLLVTVKQMHPLSQMQQLGNIDRLEIVAVRMCSAIDAAHSTSELQQSSKRLRKCGG
jgi:hypothetical protein